MKARFRCSGHLLSAGLVLASACRGNVTDIRRDDGASQDGDASDDGTGSGGEDGAPPPPGVFAPAPARLRLLTQSQYVASILRFGDVNVSAPPLPSTSLDAGSLGLSDAIVEEVETSATAASASLIKDARFRRELPCAFDTASCGRDLVEHLGALAFRRPLDATESESLTALFENERTRHGSGERATRALLTALLMAPSFLYRETRLAEGTRLTAASTAEHLSFLLTNGPPDKSLLAMAGENALDDRDRRLALFDQLVASPTAQQGTRRFFEEWLALDGMPALQKDPATYPLFSPKVAQSMREQTLRTIDALVRDGEDMGALYNGRKVFVDATLAPLYGLPADDVRDWALRDDPRVGDRVGLLGLLAPLALHAKTNKTSITDRGVFIRTQLLCQPIPQPPDDVPNLPDFDPDKTTRQQLEAHREDPTCRSCHLLFDPLGMALETYDGIGVKRTHDGKTQIDPSGELDGVPFQDAAELGQLLAAEPATMECLVRQLHRYAAGRLEWQGDQPWLERLSQEFNDNGRTWESLLRAYVGSDEFVMAKEAN